jgi:hypothetical protein
MVSRLRTAAANFIDGWNERCHPFTWMKTADQILEHGQLPRTSFTVRSPKRKEQCLITFTSR